MRAHNYYAAPGFERAGLRRRDHGWIGERLGDPASLFVPVWRNQNLVVEVDGGEPRAVVLSGGALAPLIGEAGAGDGAARPRRSGVYRGRRGARAFRARPVGGRGAARHAAFAGAGGERRGGGRERRCGPALCRSAPARPAGSTRARRHCWRLARAILFWHARHRFCGLCGSPTRSEEAGHVRRCTDPACNTMHFPRTDPAVIMLVTQGERR